MRQAGWLALVLAAASACSAPSARREAEAPRSTPASGRAETIRLEIPVAPDVADLPRLMVRDALRQRGYTIVADEYRDPTITVQALIEGRLDVADLPFTQALAGIERGAAISLIASRGGRTRVLIGAPAIKTCADLDGQQVSVSVLNSTQALTLQRFVNTRCPGTHVEMIVISRIENRVAALITHRTGAAMLDLASMLRLERLPGERYNALSVFGVDFPLLIEGSAVASRAFLDRYPETARDIVREMIVAARKVQDASVLQREIEEQFAMDADEAALVARTYLENKVWEVNGGLSPASLQASIDFAVQARLIEPGFTTAQAADRSYLDAVLADLGRQ